MFPSFRSHRISQKYKNFFIFLKVNFIEIYFFEFVKLTDIKTKNKNDTEVNQHRLNLTSMEMSIEISY